MSVPSILKEGEESIPVETAISRWAQRAFKAEAELDLLRAELAEERAKHALTIQASNEQSAQISGLRAEVARAESEISTTMTERLKAENNRLRAEVAERQWQPIETAPKDIRWLFTWDTLNYHVATRHGRGWANDRGETIEPRNWIPLLDPPKETEG